jgi:hypothetical protein
MLREHILREHVLHTAYHTQAYPALLKDPQHILREHILHTTRHTQAYPAHLKDPYLAEGTTFKINVVSVGGHMDEPKRSKLIQNCFKYVDFKGKVLMDQTRKGARAAKACFVLVLTRCFVSLLTRCFVLLLTRQGAHGSDT